MTYFGYFVQRVRKLFITSLILNKFSCGKVQIPRLRKQQTNIEVHVLLLRTIVFYTPRAKTDLESLLEVVWQNTASVVTAQR